MATSVQNATTVVNALYNGTMPTALRDRIIAAYTQLAPAGATQAQIATIMLTDLMDRLKQQLKFAESKTLTASNNAQIETDLTPLP